jgi:molybdate transport system ATP-binding protein
VFQGAGLLPHLTVAQNLDYAIRRAQAGPFDRETLVARTGIGPLLDRSPARLSGGETQRAAIVRALLSQPRLLLMDEPLSALDGEAKASLLALFEDLLGAIAIPVIYVSHDEAEARRLATRCVRLRDGTVAGIEAAP